MSEGATNGANTTTHGELGDRIAEVLNTAERAAERIRAEARAEGAEIVREAHERAAARVQELTAEPERLRNEAEQEARRIRTQAEADATLQRRAAEEHARSTIAEAESRSTAMREAAEEAKRRIEQAGLERQRELNEQIAALEQVREEAIGRVRSAVTGLRSSASDLEGSLARLGVEPLPENGQPEPPKRSRLRGLFGSSSEGDGIHESAAPAAAPSVRDELYERARELGIRGRSRMTRRELEEAVNDRQ